jgi:YD repeat-containing protein
METDYSYDILDNLVSVRQLGNGGTDTPRSRTFAYDSLSRLLCASNPESSSAPCPTTATATYTSGTTGYTYDADGNVVAKTTPAVNMSTGSETISYCYDGLNRLAYKFYSSGVNCGSGPTSGYAASYTYDISPIAGAANDVGHLTDEKSYAGNVEVSDISPYQYDAMGRLLSEQQCTISNCGGGSPYLVTYMYDLAGNQTSSTNGLPSTPGASSNPLTLKNEYDAAGHLETVISNWVDTTHPSPLFSISAPSSSPCGMTQPYAAFGGLQNATLGSGLTMSRSYDNRLRKNCELDTGVTATQ